MELTNFFSFFKVNGKYYLLNTLNSALIEMNFWHYSITKRAFLENNVNLLDKDSLNILHDNGFLINDRHYELFKIRNKYLSSKYRNSVDINLDIAVTNKCNFKCPYCYEKSFNDKMNKIHLSDKIKRSFRKDINIYLDHMLKHYNVKSIKVVWYGGEPSLEWKLIFALNNDFLNIANKYSILYSNVIITNGYLVDSEVAKKLSKQNIDYIQITMDGPMNIHNKRRILKSGKGTYEKILNNIDTVLGYGINTVIRINIDKENLHKFFY